MNFHAVNYTKMRLQRSEYFPEECLLDDSTLLRIVSLTNHADMANGDITAEGILKTFEVSFIK